MKQNRNKHRRDLVTYTDAPADIEREMDAAHQVADFLPRPGELSIRSVGKEEKRLTRAAWKRYRIKDNERGHRPPLSRALKEPTARLDTSIILPRRVYNWIRTKKNKAAFIRSIMIKSYEKTL